MLGGVKLKVCFTYEKTCFAYISPKYNTGNEQAQCIQVLCKEKPIFLWAVFGGNVAEGQMACNPIVGCLLGLSEGSEVFVSPHGDVKVLDELYIDADSPDDQEILEHNVENLQLRILDQLRLVVAYQKAVLWTTASLRIVITPKQTGLLVNNSRLIVKVDAFNMIRRKPVAPVQPENNLKFNNIGIINDSMLRPYMNTPKHLVLRALPIDSDGKKNLIHPYIVFIHEDLIAKAFDKDVPNLAILQNIPSLIKETDEGIVNLCVETVAVDSLIFKSLCREVYHRNVPTILISKSLHAIVKIEKGLKIILTPVDEQVEHPEHIEISYSNKEQQDNDIIEKFKNTIIDGTNCGKKFLVNNNMVKTNPQMTPGYIKFHLKPESMKYALLNSESLRQCTISAKSLNESDLNVQIPSTLALDYDFKNYCRTMTSVEKLVHQIVTCLNFEIHREADFKNVSGIKSNVLLTGRSGTGKSSICQIVQKELTVWSHVLRCRSLKGRKDIPDVIAKAIVTCQEHGPSVLVCDDVDCLVPANMEGLSPQDSAYYHRLAVAIKRALQSCAGVAVLMTSEAVTSLHHVLSHFPGNPLFTAHFDIPEMDLEEKTNLLSHLVNDKLRSEFTVEVDDLRRLAAGEGAGGKGAAGAGAGAGSMRGVTDLLHSCIFQAVKRKDPKSHEKPRLVPAARRGQARALAAVWAPVGGLRAARQALTECLFWPLMYPRLFPSRACGVLLYGPPGAGKSHVGSCLAAARGYNFIAVKGPELLSKYIGQSEKAVRDVFDKAEMKKPCILFFDEFDSLAPKRGHDSTGVTDRVVNQLLARLDGAEGGAAGPVLCATGRPDLLDPALLRPGRLDTHVYCGMPDESDRYEVLQRLSASTRLAPGVSLRALAARAAGRSPADLRALLVTAQLRALETRLAEADGGDLQSVEVSQEDLDFALRDTRPSLSAAQLAFYDAVYRRFRGEPLSTQDKSISSEYSQQRVTLA